MTFDQKTALRAVIDAARSWRGDSRKSGEEAAPETVVALWAAVDALEAALPALGKPNAPHGFVLTRPWELVAAGWFVRVPNGEWYEVTGTKLEGGKQHVTMRSPAGKEGTFPRDPKGEVKVRRGTHGTELDDAIEALSDVFGGVAILEDTSPPWEADDLTTEFRDAAKDTVVEWCRRWPTDSGDSMRVRYFEDGTAEIEKETATGFDRKRVTFDVIVKDA